MDGLMFVKGKLEFSNLQVLHSRILEHLGSQINQIRVLKNGMQIGRRRSLSLGVGNVLHHHVLSYLKVPLVTLIIRVVFHRFSVAEDGVHVLVLGGISEPGSVKKKVNA